MSTDPMSVNTAMIRIADSNNEDIEFMRNEIKSLNVQQKEIESRYNEQQDRWRKYKDAWEATLLIFYMGGGRLTVEEMVNSLPWSKLT